MKVRDFEAAVFALEQVRVLLRAPAATEVDDYEYDRRCKGNITVNRFVALRIANLVGDVEVVVLDPSGKPVVGQTKLETIRA